MIFLRPIYRPSLFSSVFFDDVDQSESENESCNRRGNCGTRKRKYLSEKEARSSSTNRRTHHASQSTDKQVKFSVDLPGVKPNDVSITVTSGRLSLEAVRRHVSSDGSTVKKSKIVRSMSVDPDTVDLSQTVAHLRDGVLDLVAPKQAKPEPRVITVTRPSTGNDEQNTHVNKSKKQAENTEASMIKKNEDETNDAATTDSFLFTIDVPGVALPDVSVTVDCGDIHVEAQRLHSRRTEKYTVVDKIITVNRDRVDLFGLEAHLSDGMLTLSAPLALAMNPVRITVATEQQEEDKEVQPLEIDDDDEDKKPAAKST